MSALRRHFTLAVVLWIVAGFYFQQDVGLADNGDFTRVMTRFTSGPIGVESNWPDCVVQHEDCRRRFFAYWLPFWKLDFPGKAAVESSAILLWAPGIWFRHMFVSSSVLHLQDVSFVPKVFLLLFALQVLIWAGSREAASEWSKTALCVGLGAPIGLMLVAPDYVAYLNTFYTEPASFVYLLAFVLSLHAFRGHPRVRLAVSLLCLALLATAKLSNLYWPTLATPFLLAEIRGSRLIANRARTYLTGLAAALTLTVLALRFVHPIGPMAEVNGYHRLFFGVLTLSQDPAGRLTEMGLGDMADCVGYEVYSEAGPACLAKYAPRRSGLHVLQVIASEPRILLRTGVFVAEQMQRLALEDLGKHAVENPDASTGGTALLNVWSRWKAEYFPRGKWLLVSLFIFVAAFAGSLRGSEPALARVGLLTTIATITDMYVAFFGDGRGAMIKHLYLSNVLFDLSSIAFGGIVIIYFTRRGVVASQAIRIGSAECAKKTSGAEDAERPGAASA